MIFRSARGRQTAFTIVEIITGMGVFGIFSAALMIAWTALQANAVNAAAYVQRQTDQMRVIDYLKRDIRRASTVEIYDGATLVTGSSPGTELRVTIPDYYADTREEDNAIGSSTPNAPALSGTSVNYGGTMLVRYYVTGGAINRNEEGTVRIIADAAGAFVLSFRWETNGDVLSQVFYDQPMRGSGSRTLRRQVDIVCRQRSDLQPLVTMATAKTAHALSTSARQSGSAVLGALAVLAVTLILVGTALTSASQGFRTSHQSSRWAQAALAAEAGAEIGLMTAQKNSWIADGWSGSPGAPGAAAVTKTVTLSTDVPGTGLITTALSVDKVTMGSTDWLRIRSTGNVDLSGGAVAGSDTRDSMLRKLSLRKDRKTGAAVTTPRASRTVEILAAPKAAMPFKYGFVSKALFDLQPLTTSDSYDSTDPAKSNYAPFTDYGVYDATKKQSNGDIATTDNTSPWNLNDAFIWGDVLTTGGTVNQTGNVTGSVSSGFTFNFPDEVSPDWTTVTQNHGTVNNVSANIEGGTQSSPTRHQFDGINLTNANTAITIDNPAGQTESWIELWVTGDTYIDAANLTGINIAPGVSATIHFGGRVEVKGGGGGYGITNGSQLASRLIVRAYGGSSGATKDFILTNTDFWGVVSAPWYKVKFDMAGKHAYGSFLAWQFDASNGTNLHYDEALVSLTHGEGPGYSVRSWVEAVR